MLIKLGNACQEAPSSHGTWKYMGMLTIMRNNLSLGAVVLECFPMKDLFQCMDDQSVCFRFALFTQLHGLGVSDNSCHGQSAAVGCVLISEHAPCYLLILLQNCSLFTFLF